MLRLMLLRHAKTERLQRGQHDRERKLTKRGRADAGNVAQYMVSYCLVPDQVIVSPARRTQETWALLAKAFAVGPNVVTDEGVYEASAETLIDVIAKAHEGRSLLVIGHNPSLHDLAVQLIRSGNAAAREQLSENLPTSGLVVIDLQLERWSQLQPHPQAGPLERFVTPRFIAATVM
jgi:phosphohistidine phosphatase